MSAGPIDEHGRERLLKGHGGASRDVISKPLPHFRHSSLSFSLCCYFLLSSLSLPAPLTLIAHPLLPTPPLSRLLRLSPPISFKESSSVADLQGTCLLRWNKITRPHCAFVCAPVCLHVAGGRRQSAPAPPRASRNKQAKPTDRLSERWSDPGRDLGLISASV